MGKMNILPDAKELWKGIGGHFDSLSQVLCEFIDNTISNYRANKVPMKTIRITLNKSRNGNAEVLIEDSGTGIKELDSAFKLGDKEIQESPMNEHGFGFKHALATADPENNNWEVYTRTEDNLNNGVYKYISAPYKYDIESKNISINDKRWPGEFNKTGTIIKFECSMELFNTIQKGIRGRASFSRCLDYLREELGYIYSFIIEQGEITINIISDEIDNGNGQPYNEVVPSIKPNIVDYYKPKNGSIKKDLGGGEVKIDYVFAQVDDNENNIKYYKKNGSSNGLELRINGRIMETNLFKEVWELENHPSYNHYLVQVNLISDNLSALPKTRTSKNGLRVGDKKLDALFNWIRSASKNKPPKQLAGAIHERELVSKLSELKENHLTAPDKHIETEYEVFKSINSPVPVDLYVYDGHNITLYEAKKDIADVKSIYQLLMYWDGAVMDGLKPHKGVLIASEFSDGVDDVIDFINSKKDDDGNDYNFTKTTWKNNNIGYPKP